MTVYINRVMECTMSGCARDVASGLSTGELAAAITELAGHLNAANRRWLALIAEFDRRKGWSDSATQSCAHWLNWQCGLDLGAAREKLRVAHALEQLPLMAAAMARGELSYSKARALTRVATAATEEYLLAIGLHGTAHHVEQLVRQYRRVQEAEELSREERQQARRSVSYYFDDDDGSLVLKARLPAEAGMLVLKALEAAMQEIPLPREDCEDLLHFGRCHGTDVGRCRDTDVSAETSVARERSTSVARERSTSVARERSTSVARRVPPTARRADALALVAESFLKHGAEAMSGGERHQVVVHVDLETLRTRGAGRSEFEHGPAMPAETARRLACDCSVITIVEDEHGQPLDVGRKTRSIPPALRRALDSRDKGCVFPGCTHQRYVDGHHVHHWAEGGETKLSNLVSLCRFHHRQVHEGDIRIERLDDGAWRFVNAQGQSWVSSSAGHTQPLLGEWTALVFQHSHSGICIDAQTARTHWRGERMDYGLAIDVLLGKDTRARNLQGSVMPSMQLPDVAHDAGRYRNTDVERLLSRDPGSRLAQVP
jgi:hypothetical protein